MSRYEISDEEVDLLKLDIHQINAKLSPLVRVTDKVFCLCMPEKLPMHVSRKGPNYFPVKSSKTGALHHKLCKHNSLTASMAALMGYTLEAISSADLDEVNVTLTKPLIKGNISPSTITSQFAFKQGLMRPVTNRMTELGLLHLMWERASLHEYHPMNIVGSLWPKIRRAACGIHPQGLKELKYGLSDLLLLPLHAETINQNMRNYAKFRHAQNNNQFVLFVAKLNKAEVACLLAAETTDFSLSAQFGVNLTLYTDSAKPLTNALHVSFSTELSYSQSTGDDLIVLGIAKPASSANYSEISSMVLMPVIAGHVPYDSSYEKRFTLELVRQHRWFKKPLRYEAARDRQVHPDFMLLDTQEPVVVEVYGMNTLEYRHRKEEKRMIYASEGYPYKYWEWDAAKCSDLAVWLRNHPLPKIG